MHTARGGRVLKKLRRGVQAHEIGIGEAIGCHLRFADYEQLILNAENGVRTEPGKPAPGEFMSDGDRIRGGVGRLHIRNYQGGTPLSGDKFSIAAPVIA
jgi:hypothetical protein